MQNSKDYKRAKMVLFQIAFGLSVFVGTTCLNAQIVPPSAAQLAELDERVLAYLHQNNIPGGLIAVASKGVLIHIKPYGLANVELEVPVHSDTVFEIGSISKQFISAVALLLVEEQKLSLDDPVHRYLSGLPGEWLNVSVRHLLQHTSGIPDYEEIAGYDLYQNRLVPEEVIKIAHSRPMDFEPGQGWHYSNTGYYLVSMLIEHIEGKPIGQVLKERVFEPLEMHQTQMADPEAIIPNRAAGYWVNKTGTLINRRPTETSSTLGAGGLLSSVSDLVKWDHALNDDSLLSSESKALIWTPATLPNGQKTGYGLGWELHPYQGQRYLSHTGQVAGFLSSFDRFPNHEAAFILFLNLYDVSTEIKYPVFHTFIPSLGALPE